MPGLTELQQAFKRYLMAGDPKIATHIAGSDRLGGDQRLAVYANAYRARLEEALASDYRALQALTGDAEFSDLCHAYIDAHPSSHYSLRWFGQHLAGFLRRSYGEQPYLAELAGFEWMLAEAFDATDAPVTQVSEVERMPAEAWPFLRIRLQPSVRRLTLTWNVLDLWRSFKDEAILRVPRCLPEPVTCLIWRDGLTTRYRSLEPDEQAALKVAAWGGSFAEICDRLASREHPEQELALRAAGLLKTWLSSGLVSELAR